MRPMVRLVFVAEARGDARAIVVMSTQQDFILSLNTPYDNRLCDVGMPIARYGDSRAFLCTCERGTPTVDNIHHSDVQ